MANIFYKYLDDAIRAVLQRTPTKKEWDRAYEAVPYHTAEGKIIERDRKKCKHKRYRQMEWPDGGASICCITCLMTKHYTEQEQSDWQDHDYRSIADWYKEAEELQRGMEKICGT